MAKPPTQPTHTESMRKRKYQPTPGIFFSGPSPNTAHNEATGRFRGGDSDAEEDPVEDSSSDESVYDESLGKPRIV